VDRVVLRRRLLIVSQSVLASTARTHGRTDGLMGLDSRRCGRLGPDSPARPGPVPSRPFLAAPFIVRLSVVDAGAVSKNQ